MPGKEPNPEDAPYRPVPPGGKPWPGYPKPKPAPKLAKHVNAHDKDAHRRNTAT